MTTTRELLVEAYEPFGDKVHAVAPDRWDAPTPCTDWSVRDVVNHIVAEHLWVPHLLCGETLEQVGDRYDGDVLGDDPVGAWDRASAEASAAWRGLPSDDELVHLSFGLTPAREYAEQMLLDLTVHGWDLARGAGLEDRMDPAAARHVLAAARERTDALRGSGLFADPVDVASDDPQDQLLGLLGRRP